MSNGVFIVFEGGEGGGKTTQARILADRLRARLNRPVHITRQPGGTGIGAHIRTLLLATGLGHHTIPPKAEALLYLADRAAHAPDIRRRLEQGEIVICDRWADSSAVYQGIGRNLGMHHIVDLSRWAADDLTPDLTIVLDIDPAIGLRRLANRGSGRPDRIESEPVDFHTKVRDGFLHLAQVHASHDQRYTVIDATPPPEEVAADVWEAVFDLGPAIVRYSADRADR